MNYLKILFISFIILILSSCTKNKEMKIPSWYLNTYSNNHNFIYGNAQAYSLKEAKLLALEDMTNKLSTNIKSSFSTTTKTNKYYYSKEMIRKIEQNSYKINFNNYKVIKSQLIDDTYFIILRVNKQNLFSSYKTKFDIINDSIKKQYKLSYTNSKLEQIKILQNIIKHKITKATNLLYILNAIDINFDISEYLQFYEIISIKLNSLKKQINIDVLSNENNKYFSSSFINLLNLNNFNINKDTKYKVIINNTIIYSKYMGWNIAKVKSDVIFKDEKNLVNSFTINSIGRSVSSKQSAFINASQIFSKKINDIGIDNFLFN